LKENCGGSRKVVIMVGGVVCKSVVDEFLGCVDKLRGLKTQTDNDKQNWSGLQSNLEEKLLAICKIVKPEAADSNSLSKKHAKLGQKKDNVVKHKNEMKAESVV
jgi:hypothetical protein